MPPRRRDFRLDPASAKLQHLVGLAPLDEVLLELQPLTIPRLDPCAELVVGGGQDRHIVKAIHSNDTCRSALYLIRIWEEDAQLWLTFTFLHGQIYGHIHYQDHECSQP